MSEESDFLDEHFPLGDGAAETEVEVICPHCGEPGLMVLDPGGGSEQEYVEDCQVCCRPRTVHLRYDAAGRAEVWLRTDDE